MNNSIFSLLTFLCIFSLSGILHAQNFEGWITYKMEVLNPNPALIPDSAWQEGVKKSFGERGYMLQKYYYKQDRYLSEVDAGPETGFQLYNPEDKFLYSWQKGSSTAIASSSEKSLDTFLEIVDAEKVDTVLGIPCQSIVVKTSALEMTLWYNRDYFKMDAKFYEGHILGHWEQILKKIGCFPLKTEIKGGMSHILQTAIEFKEGAIEDSKFEMPEFEEVNKI